MPEAFSTKQFIGLELSTFVFILLVGLLAGGGAFVWTLERADPAAFIARDRGRDDPDPAFGNRVRQFYALGGYSLVAEACETRREEMPSDAEAWLYGALAHEHLAQRPGLDALEDKTRAIRLWEGLYQKSVDRSTRLRGGRRYMQGWALQGLGRPMLANELFREHFENTQASTLGLDSYNRACYLAIAGEHDAAQHAWARAARRQNLQPGWARADPDLESLQGTYAFQIWERYYTLTRRSEWRRLRPPAAPGTNGTPPIAPPARDAAPGAPDAPDAAMPSRAHAPGTPGATLHAPRGPVILGVDG